MSKNPEQKDVQDATRTTKTNHVLTSESVTPRFRRLYNYCYERALRANGSMVLAFHNPRVKFEDMDYLKKRGHVCERSKKCLIRDYDERKKRENGN